MKYKNKIFLLQVVIILTGIYILIFLPFLKFNNLKLSLLKYEKEHSALLINQKKQKVLIQEEKENIQIKKENLKEVEDEIFDSSSEGLSFIGQILIHYDIELLVIGREDSTSLENLNIKNKIYLNVLGDEKAIYGLIKAIDNADKQITILKEGILLEKNEKNLELKANIMYISKNKKTELNYSGYENEIFKKKNKREIGKKRRIL
ncbi:hypothetical protein [uncultured Cetobacterium sp.]|uniref:hypothetical protein n=1 Tax=uncultured Cetobacterium sp. TaxID=527638 RepID=UPI002603C2A1|nr:hypothetical protein [uncultured Cetobacterium sp.]